MSDTRFTVGRPPATTRFTGRPPMKPPLKVAFLLKSVISARKVQFCQESEKLSESGETPLNQQGDGRRREAKRAEMNRKGRKGTIKSGQFPPYFS